MAHTQRDFKAEAVRQWTADPCGSSAGDGLDRETPAYFATIEHDRYVTYAPWLRETVRFGDYGRQRVLEIGFGQGTDLMQFARAGATVTGVDLSSAHLALTQRRFALEGRTATLQLADAEAMPFDDASFDVVYSFGVLHHTPNVERALAEIARVLVPGGLFLSGVYHRRSLFELSHRVHYIRQGWYRTESYEDSWWRIEEQASDSGARPLVNRYTRRQWSALLAPQFTVRRTAVRHLGVGERALAKILPSALRTAMAQRFGWYLMTWARPRARHSVS